MQIERNPPPPSNNAVVPPPGLGWEKTAPHFELRATKPMKKGMIRLALGNNCSTGQNAQCGFLLLGVHGIDVMITCSRLLVHSLAVCSTRGVAQKQDEYISLLRTHSDVYPSGA